jgi:ABC-type Fe3+-hydroxamate transport system substrate-binding protein
MPTTPTTPATGPSLTHHRAPSPRRRPAAAGIVRAVACAIASALLLLTACTRPTPPTPTSPPPGTSSTHSGGTGSPPAPHATEQPRIAALAPALAVIARDLGLGPALCARHAYDAWSDPALPTAGDQGGIDYDALIRAGPTHVLLQWGRRDLPEPLVRLAAANRWTLASFTLETLDDIERTITRFGELFPHAAPAAQRALEDFRRRTRPPPGRARPDPRAAPMRVLLLHSVNPPAAFGPGSYHHQLLERLGGHPAITRGALFMPLQAEDVLRLQPDAILLIQPRPPGAPPASDAPAEVIERFGPIARLRIPAVQAGRLALIDEPLALVPGTNLADLAQAMDAHLRRWQPDAPTPEGPPPTGAESPDAVPPHP